MHNPAPLVINWHLTEACNYRCQYCYAAWSESACPRELIHDPERTAALLSELYRFFRSDNRVNPLASRMSWYSVRLNLAGGEPLLHANKLPAMVSQARALGFEVSLISNGSRLTREMLDQLAPQLTWLGISLDSANSATNRAIGRIDRRGQLLDLDQLATNLYQARQNNPQLRLKLNTVVNQLNHTEDLTALVRSFAPEKWKVLRMLPVVNQHLAVSDQQFAAFVARHGTFTNILCAEDNHDMRESYLMVDLHGRFFQNSPLIVGQGYTYSRPILEVGAGAAFAEMTFDHERFNARYIPASAGVGA
ncbi:viperin family antiviral radical SAM protein [Pseudomonas sp. SA3-5]|uniref:S-adenosylmethionine-dependent nucleotide dehydratase n=1 Tax=Pseudomonas aestuarii TaxID=3018340 RepID=A0ABT4XL86_9PSED|nr:viperin family antiviral radical SAM protein [Pseudomonas aestuarii]MDA7088964.1 viperin family antiviral radical SAM protein [Pseudomonas aestuarii]